MHGRVRAHRGEAHNRPPCASMIARLIERSIPMPPGLVVKQAWNSRSMAAGSMPLPTSCTATHT